jgi:hypothetical protein
MSWQQHDAPFVSLWHGSRWFRPGKGAARFWRRPPNEPEYGGDRDLVLLLLGPNSEEVIRIVGRVGIGPLFGNASTIPSNVAREESETRRLHTGSLPGKRSHQRNFCPDDLSSRDTAGRRAGS